MPVSSDGTKALFAPFDFIETKSRLNHKDMMVLESRDRQESSWTVFDASPFFAGNSKSSKKSKDAFLDWSLSKRAPLDVPSPSPKKSTGKSVGTATTVSTSASPSPVKDAGLYSPTIAQELQLGPSVSGITQRKSIPLPHLQWDGMLDRQAERVTKDRSHRERALEDIRKDSRGPTEEDETDFSAVEPQISSNQERQQQQQGNRTSPNEACMPLALEDLREMVTTSMNKAVGFWSQMQKFVSQKLDHETMRKRDSNKSISRPTTVFILPSTEGSHPRTSSLLESLADSLTNPTFLEDDLADDMSSLTEPHFFHSQRLPPVLRIPMRQIEAGKDATKQVKINSPGDGDECIDFRSENVEIYEKDSLFDYELLMGETPLNGSELSYSPNRPSILSSERSLHGRFRTFLPRLKPRYQVSCTEPLQRAKVELVWSQDIPEPGISGTSQVLSLGKLDVQSVSC